MIPRRFFTLGRLIPVLLGIALTLDVSGHFLPVDWFAFRAWEAIFRYPVKDGPCTPRMHYKNAHTFGDLPTIANQPTWREYRQERFTTDDFGFRQNPGDKLGNAYDAIMLGDSFALGSRLNDEETLTAQLEQISGRRIFNAGALKIDLRRLRQLLDHVGMKKGVVFYEYLERNDPLPLADVAYHDPKPRTRFDIFHKIAEKTWDGFWLVCPVQILSQRLYKKWQNDQMLPNPYESRVVVDQLKNGKRILFVPEEVDNFTRYRFFDIAGILELRKELLARGLELRVILVPDKLTVYSPLLEHPRPDPKALYLNKLEKTLRHTDIPVLNLLPIFRSVAAERMGHGEYLYFSDDTHWNANGARLAAEMIHEKFDF